MPANFRFWRNLTLIGLAHIAFIAGLVRWSHSANKPRPENLIWLSGAGDGLPSESKAVSKISKSFASVPLETSEPAKRPEIDDDQPLLTSVDSEIQLPTPTPKRTPRPTPRPTPRVTESATPSPTVTPMRRPKTIAAENTPKKKIILAKASPKPAKPKRIEKDEDEPKPAVTEKKAESKPEPAASPQLVQTDSAKSDHPTGKGASGGGGRIGGPGGQSQFGWYGSMLHDRLYSEWAQPTAVASSGEKFSVMVRLRIQKDGRVTKFEIVKTSGNTTVDESVAAVANRVSQVDPLPAGLGNGDHYDVKINFELSSE